MIDGQVVTRDALQNLVQFQQWLAANPQQLAAIDAYVRGDADALAPRQTTTEPSPDDDGDEWVDPKAAEEIGRLRQQIDGLSATQRQAAQAELMTGLETGQWDAAVKHGLSAEETEALTNAVAQSQILPAFAARHPGNPAAAMAEALDYTYWNTPQFRQRELDRMVDEKVQEALDANAAAGKRKAKAGSLSGSGGSVPRAEVPRSPQEKQKAMVDEIAHAISENRGG